MRQILILGGIGEARWLAEQLHAVGRRVIYSVAGITDGPDMACALRVGGFGGGEGLAHYLVAAQIGMLIDATHPYARTISANAVDAARAASVPLWCYRRPAWQPSPAEDWRDCADWEAIVTAMADFSRPLLTVGRTPLDHEDQIRPRQHWLVRCLDDCSPRHPRLSVIRAKGPFDESDELRLMRRHRIDVLVSKNSGGDAVAGKLRAARALRLPVLMWARPKVAAAEPIYECIKELADSAKSYTEGAGW